MIKESLRILICFKRLPVFNVLPKLAQAQINVVRNSEESGKVNFQLHNPTELAEVNEYNNTVEEYLKTDASIYKYVMIITQEKSSLPRNDSQKNLEWNYVDDENVNLDFLAICA